MGQQISLSPNSRRKFQENWVRTADAHQRDNQTLLIGSRCAKLPRRTAQRLYAEVIESPDRRPPPSASSSIPTEFRFRRVTSGHRQRRAGLAASVIARFRDSERNRFPGLKSNDQVIINPPDSVGSGGQESAKSFKRRLPGRSK